MHQACRTLSMRESSVNEINFRRLNKMLELQQTQPPMWRNGRRNGLKIRRYGSKSPMPFYCQFGIGSRAAQDRPRIVFDRRTANDEAMMSSSMHIDFNSLFSGLAGVIVGAVITYLLQHRLLDKQLAAAKESQKAFIDLLTEFRNMLNTRLGFMTSEMEKQNAKIIGRP